MSMKKGLERYKDKEKAIKYTRDYNKAHRTDFLFQFNNETDAELIDDLKKAPVRIELVRQWYRAYKELIGH